MDREISFVLTRGAWDGVNAQYTITWSKFVEWLPKNRCSIQVKTQSMMINTGQFRTVADGAVIAVYKDDVINKKTGEVMFKAGTPRLNSKGLQMPARNKVNMIGYDALALDYDSGVTLKEILEKFSDYECVYYTTYSHMVTGIEKFRVIIPFTEFCPVGEYTNRSDAFTAFSDGAVVDNTTFSASRAFYLPSNPVGHEEQAVDGHQSGNFLDWRLLPVNAPKPVFVSNVISHASNAKTVYTKQQMDSVISQLLGRGQFTYNDSFTIVNVLYNSGYTLSDYIFFCKFWRPHEDVNRIQEQWGSCVGKAPMDFKVLVNILEGKSKIKFRVDPH